ncbi:MAG TPA: response regulator transcription factor [Balneolales bacterium]|nr:response regulator transcription factor [Balneolales bacterium]
MEKIKVIIADDHDIVRFGISSVLQSAKDIDVVGEASDGDETLELYKKFKPDVALIDITMPGKSGIETTEALLKESPDAKILILTMHMDETYLSKSIKAGALGYLLKNCEKDELLEGVRAAAEGKKVFSTAISRLITESYVSNLKDSQDRKPAPKKETHLTKREQQILGLIAEGLTSQEIANKLTISPRTVETHRANLLQKLDIKNTAGLVRYAIENGHLNS